MIIKLKRFLASLSPRILAPFLICQFGLVLIIIDAAYAFHTYSSLGLWFFGLASWVLGIFMLAWNAKRRVCLTN